MGQRQRLHQLRPRLGQLDTMRRVVAAPVAPEDAERDRKARLDHDRRGDPIRALYSTARWRRLRVEIYADRAGLCQECGRITALHKREASDHMPVANFDHVEGARERPDLFWSREHIRLLCHPCHSARTARDQGFAARPGQRPLRPVG